MAKSMHVAGDELKKLLKLGKKRPMPFAFCPSGGDDDNILIIHRKRKPEMLGKIARKEGEGTKIAFGTFTVKGKELTATCERQLAGLAKRLKRHLKAEKMPLNIVILDASGEVLESDIEELPDDDLLDGADDLDENEDDDADQDAGADEDEENDELLNAKDLAGRLKAIKPDVDALQGDFGVKLAKLMGASAGAIKSGNLDVADKSIAAIEAALERMQGATAPDAPAAPDEAMLALVQRINKAKSAAGDLQDDAQKKISDFLGKAVALVKKGDAAQATKIMDAVDQALSKAGGGAQDPKAAEWAKVEAKLAAEVQRSLGAGVGDMAQLTTVWEKAQKSAADGDFAAALAAAPNVVQLIKDAKAQPQPQSYDDLPMDVVPFTKSREIWVETTKTMRSELDKLIGAMDKALNGLEGFEDIASNTGDLHKHLAGFDGPLEKALRSIEKSQPGAERESLIKEARGIVGGIEQKLESEFFKNVDANNGFASVQVKSTAIKALSKVNAALA